MSLTDRPARGGITLPILILSPDVALRVAWDPQDFIRPHPNQGWGTRSKTCTPLWSILRDKLDLDGGQHALRLAEATPTSVVCLG